MDRLETHYGPGFRSNPQAKAILDSFNNLLTQNQDINSLDSLIASGKRVEDYLASNEILAPARDYVREAR